MPCTCRSAPSQEFVLQEITASSIVVDNNRIIPAGVLTDMTSPYLNQRISYIDLEVLRNKLTQWLIDKGYINSGVVIPDQDVNGGTIHLAVVEGALSSVKVEGNRYFSKNYFIDRITRTSGIPFRIGDLQDAFQLLYQDQRITAINAELAGGLAPGESNLTIRVSEASPWQLMLSATNDNSPNIGSYHGSVLAAHHNLTGNGDTLEGSFGGSEGGYDYGARYSRPLTAADTTLDIYFRRSDATVIDPLFKPLDIRSNSATYGGRISHPLVKNLRREVRPSLTGEYRESTNFLLGEGFSFSNHEKDGRNSFSVVRPGLEWIERWNGGVFVGSTQLSSGVTDEGFTTWLGRVLLMQRTEVLGSRINLRGEAQLADTDLPGMEKYALGGMNSVRGYRKNVLVKDNGVNGSLEWWFPLVRDNLTGSEYFSVIPFIDYGRGWDSNHEASKGIDLASIGLGLHGAWKGLSVDFFYGYGLLKKDIATGKDPQEQGIHFAVTWNVL
ncbi:MAG: ShlB/FhaC/HecB family hemolysin secretion/activation protein [Desulfuromonadales bacterium]|nr:ShlB/FhaC/HecB family hemolysin secretion/activation protein [Desulfuromonadales bacterium]